MNLIFFITIINNNFNIFIILKKDSTHPYSPRNWKRRGGGDDDDDDVRRLLFFSSMSMNKLFPNLQNCFFYGKNHQKTKKKNKKNKKKKQKKKKKKKKKTKKTKKMCLNFQ